MENSGFIHGPTNASSPEDIPPGSNQTNGTEVALKIIACATVAIFSIVGNVLVVIVVFKVPRMKTATFFLLVNMSISDLLFTSISMPPLMLAIMGHGLLFGGSAGIFVCKFVNSSTFGLMASIVLSMTAIAFDRYFAVKVPTRKIIHGKTLKGIIAAIWIISILVMVPLLCANTLGEEEGVYYCYENWPTLMDDPQLASKIYTIILFCIIYMVPFITMGVLYSSLAYNLWFRKIVGTVNVQNQKYVRKRRQKVVCMLVVVLGAFICCWLPLQVIAFLYFFSDAEIPGYTVFVGEFLVHANGALNPLCYLCFSQTFRQGVLKVKPFRYCFVRQQGDRSTGTTAPICFRRKPGASYNLFKRPNGGRGRIKSCAESESETEL